MKIYKLDGTYTEAKNNDFGWFLKDFIVDENEANFAERNLYTVSRSVSSLILSDDESDFEQRTSPDQEVVNLIRPKIEEYVAESVLNTSPRPEGLKKCNKSRQSDDNEKLTTLINPCNSETQALLSVVNNSKYRSFIEKCKNPEDIFDFIDVRNKVKYLIARNETDRSKLLTEEVRDFKENSLSLMAELILADMNCDVLDNITTTSAQEAAPKKIATVNFKLDESFTQENNGCFIISKEKRANILNSIGIGDEIDKSIDSFCREFQDMHVQLADLKESLYVDDTKTTNLIHEAKSLIKDIKETIFLEDLLHLLNGELDKVKTKKWPFKIFHKQQECGGNFQAPNTDIDLII